MNKDLSEVNQISQVHATEIGKINVLGVVLGVASCNNTFFIQLHDTSSVMKKGAFSHFSVQSARDRVPLRDNHVF